MADIIPLRDRPVRAAAPERYLSTSISALNAISSQSNQLNDWTPVVRWEKTWVTAKPSGVLPPGIKASSHRAQFRKWIPAPNKPSENFDEDELLIPPQIVVEEPEPEEEVIEQPAAAAEGSSEGQTVSQIEESMAGNETDGDAMEGVESSADETVEAGESHGPNVVLDHKAFLHVSTSFKGPSATPPNSAAALSSPHSSVIVEPGTPFPEIAKSTTAAAGTPGSSLKAEILPDEAPVENVPTTQQEDVEMDG
ncbi:hypothetical protein HDV05_000309 [Chytridiales sp. JEL 0842]|nr:hypothetical protein HDV05_000309 [Chytridiales sp. JEL 0842]